MNRRPAERAAFLRGAFAAVGVARASAGWPTAAARVVKSEIRDNHGANGLPGHRTLVASLLSLGALALVAWGGWRLLRIIAG